MNKSIIAGFYYLVFIVLTKSIMCAIMVSRSWKRTSITRRNNMDELDMFNYEKNIKVTETPNKDVVISMNKEIFTQMVNAIYDGAEYEREAGRNATAKFIMDMWKALEQ